MNNFTHIEILSSTIAAIFFGVGYGFFVCLLDVLICIIKGCLSSSVKLFYYEKILSSSRVIHIKNMQIKGRAYIFFKIILFSTGFMFLSYMMLDGLIRAYMLIVYSAAYFVSNIAFLNVFKRAILYLVDKIFFVIFIVLRIFTFPFSKIYYKFKKIIK